jgi:carbonic anhydrase/acetyltransferase-like protein (isoleucine patch superfamily)
VTTHEAGRDPARGDAPFVHRLAFVCGDVALGAGASVWPFAVVRGDNERIVIGAASNVQDGAVLHADPGLPCTLGARVSVGHRAVVHGATVGDQVLVGMGALVLNGAILEEGSLIGAGAVVREGMRVPAGSLVVGVPGRVVRAVTEDERARIRRTAEAYLRLQVRHRAGEFPTYGRDG